jgi:uncharacterized protein YbjT (DUF2867 family)
MIFVTGGTGFIGKRLVNQLITSGKPVRTLLRPSKKSPQLPFGVPVEAAVCSLRDATGLQAAMRDVDILFHLAGTERLSSRARLNDIDVQGTETLMNAAVRAGVEKVFFLSHLGADRFSAYPLLRAKGMAEQYIIQSGIPSTIFRTAPVYGPGDQFTCSIAQLIRISPGIFLLPGNGGAVLQPLWVDDLISCLMIALDNPQINQQVYSIGGVDFLSFRRIVEIVMETIGIKRRMVSLSPPHIRMAGLFIELFGRFPISTLWLDTLATDRTTQLDTLPRVFGILPARFHTQLEYLKS